MQNNNNQSKNGRGSSPRKEQKQDIDHSVKGVRSIEKIHENSQTPLCRDEQQENQKRESSAQGHSPPRQSDDEGRWQDDGGEGG